MSVLGGNPHLKSKTKTVALVGAVSNFQHRFILNILLNEQAALAESVKSDFTEDMQDFNSPRSCH
jgi:hypothetical protein